MEQSAPTVPQMVFLLFIYCLIQDRMKGHKVYLANMFFFVSFSSILCPPLAAVLFFVFCYIDIFEQSRPIPKSIFNYLTKYSG